MHFTRTPKAHSLPYTHAHGLVSCCHMLSQLPVVVAAYAGRPELAAAVETAVRAQQNNATSVMYGTAAAQLLEKVGRGAGLAKWGV